jgi:hypothetical protein
VFTIDEIIIYSSSLCFYIENPNCKITILKDSIEYSYKGNSYYLDILDANITKHDGYIKITPNNDKCILKPKKIN